jgi:hypothetical protein
MSKLDGVLVTAAFVTMVVAVVAGTTAMLVVLVYG